MPTLAQLGRPHPGPPEHLVSRSGDKRWQPLVTVAVPRAVWTAAAIADRKELIEAAGLTWSVVESIPVHEDIKRGGPSRDRWIAAYQESVRSGMSARRAIGRPSNSSDTRR
ncbi:hypothetical protein EUA98_16420 [Pengzhenrongella frigida]|uniref:mannonate dehydratase n=1 Tax=Pengzhenrongella frigida TaxID=1259133 RepID=A0A4Q5MWB8_9MICO|nr:hypothetical protein EUA98_16420 [Cellulomonas sp. HLT2-17]